MEQENIPPIHRIHGKGEVIQTLHFKVAFVLVKVLTCGAKQYLITLFGQKSYRFF